LITAVKSFVSNFPGLSLEKAVAELETVGDAKREVGG